MNSNFRLVALVFFIATFVDLTAESMLVKERQKNVAKELKISQAQSEEMQSIVSSLKNDSRTLRKKYDMLESDLQQAQLQEKVDEKKVQKLIKDMLEVKAEIAFLAQQKMKEIQSILTKNQLEKLQELRKNELERVIAEQKASDLSDDNSSKRHGSRSMSFVSFSSFGSDDDMKKYFDPSMVFSYPDKDLWVNANSFPMNSFKMFGDDENGFDFNFGPRSFNINPRNFMEDENSDDIPFRVTPPGAKPRLRQGSPDGGLKEQELEKLKEELEDLKKELNKKE